LNPALPFTVNFTAFGTVAIEPRIELFIYRGGIGSGQLVFSELFASSTLTSILLPANTLEPGQLYALGLSFQNNNLPGIEGDVNFSLPTYALFNTSGPTAVPEPGTVLGGVLALAGIVLFHRRRAAKQLS